jgi:hypothetical protein
MNSNAFSKSFSSLRPLNIALYVVVFGVDAPNFHIFHQGNSRFTSLFLNKVYEYVVYQCLVEPWMQLSCL